MVKKIQIFTREIKYFIYSWNACDLTGKRKYIFLLGKFQILIILLLGMVCWSMVVQANMEKSLALLFFTWRRLWVKPETGDFILTALKRFLAWLIVLVRQWSKKILCQGLWKGLPSRDLYLQGKKSRNVKVTTDILVKM